MTTRSKQSAAAKAKKEGDTITGDGTGNALPPMEEMPGVFVRTKRPPA